MPLLHGVEINDRSTVWCYADNTDKQR